MSEATNKLRDVVIYSDSVIRVRDLAADAIEAVEAQVAEAVARVAALEPKPAMALSAGPPEGGFRVGDRVMALDIPSNREFRGLLGTIVPCEYRPQMDRLVAVALDKDPEGLKVRTSWPVGELALVSRPEPKPAPSAVPAPRGFREGDIVRIKRTANGHEGWHGQEGPLVRDGIGLRPKLRFKGIGEPLVVAFHPHDYDLVRAADAPEAPAEDAGLVERLAEVWIRSVDPELSWPTGASDPIAVRRGTRGILSALRAESIHCAPGEVARLTEERDDWKYAAEVQKKDTEGWKARAEAAEETQRLRDAAISVCATSNTRDSAKRHRLDRSNPNWSHGYERVYEAVEREMCHRERAEAAEKERDEARAISAATAERVRNETQIATELRKDLADANDRLTSQSRSIEEMHAEMVDLRAKLAAAEQALDVERRTSIDHDGKTFVHPTREARLTSTAESWSPWMRYHKQVKKERDALRAELDEAKKWRDEFKRIGQAAEAELATLKAKPRFRTRKVTKDDVYELMEHKGTYYESCRALGFRRRVDGAK